jgi:hypothetical protein
MNRALQEPVWGSLSECIHASCPYRRSTRSAQSQLQDDFLDLDLHALARAREGISDILPGAAP